MALHFGSMLGIIVMFVFENYCVAELVNVALGKPAFQTDTYEPYVASNSVDGITFADMSAGFCSTTTGDALEDYWEVDLGDVYKIDHVDLYNRQDCCSERTRNVQVYVGLDQDDYVLSGYRDGWLGLVHTFQMAADTYGRWVRITRDSVYYEALNICEVEVYAESLTEMLPNVALGKPTFQSDEEYPSSKSVDGITYIDLTFTYCSSTSGLGSTDFWEVDLEDVYMIDHVVVYNRLDCCSERTRNVQVFVGFDQNNYVLSGYLGGILNAKHIFQMDSDTYGRWVRISRDSVFESLNICEVEVYAEPLTNIKKSLINVALGKPAFQTDTHETNVASNAVDGNTSGDMFAGSCIRTLGLGTTDYWEVDLEDVYMIFFIDLYNRLDCCGDTTRNVQVYVGFDQNSYVLSGYLDGLLGSNHTFQMDAETHGRWVRISRDSVDGILNFCEVEVYAVLLTNVNKAIIPLVSNVALGKSAFQSSTDDPFTSNASMAVDGVASGQFVEGSCIHTSSGSDEYWEVDLGDVYRIDHVYLYNRLDCCGERTRNIQVLVGFDQNNYVLSGYREGLLGDWHNFQMDLHTYGRWVRISRDSVYFEAMNFCEVEVFAELLINMKTVRFELLSNKTGVTSLLSAIPNSSAIFCAAVCKSSNSCVGFNFDTSTLECTTFGAATTSSDSIQGHVFYGKG